jgi:hypothetical protein
VGIYFFRDDEDWFCDTCDKNSQGSGKGSLLMEELKKNKDSLNGLVVDHENDVKQNKEHYKSLVVLCQKRICKDRRFENYKNLSSQNKGQVPIKYKNNKP